MTDTRMVLRAFVRTSSQIDYVSDVGSITIPELWTRAPASTQFAVVEHLGRFLLLDFDTMTFDADAFMHNEKFISHRDFDSAIMAARLLCVGRPERFGLRRNIAHGYAPVHYNGAHWV